MGKTKEALSTQLSHEQVKRLSGKDVKKFFKRHEAYLGGKTTETMIQSFFMLARKAIDMVIKVDDVEALQNDLQKDFVINSTLSSVAGNMVLRSGRLVAVANAALITVWHINFEKEPAKELEKEPAKELVQEPWKEADYKPVKIFTL